MALRPPLESYEEAKACAAAAKAGWSNVKILRRGYPDRLFWRNRVYVWIEMKRRDEDLRPQQAFRAREFERQGERVLKVDRWQELVAKLEEVS